MTIALVADNDAIQADLVAREASPLSVRGLTVSYGQSPALFSVDVTMREGAMTAIVGPNGAGKSTLLKSSLGLVKPLSGSVSVYGKPMSEMRDHIAYVPQRASVDWDFPTRVMDVVLMGMYRQLGLLGRVRTSHRDHAAACLDRVGMADFADRQIGQLSGGQQQRVFLARALAQNSKIFLLDEPFAGVDAATETAIVSVLHALRDEGRTIIAVHHDLNAIPTYFDDLILLNRSVIAAGPVKDVFKPEYVRQAYAGQVDTPSPTPEQAYL